MALRKLKPKTPSTRYYTVSSFEEITKSNPEKSLLAPLKKSGGRNNLGRMTSRHRGGGHKRRYRKRCWGEVSATKKGWLSETGQNLNGSAY